jgi:hypothetical protein
MTTSGEHGVEPSSRHIDDLLDLRGEITWRHCSSTVILD